jgi:hypothetical protein
LQTNRVDPEIPEFEYYFRRVVKNGLLDFVHYHQRLCRSIKKIEYSDIDFYAVYNVGENGQKIHQNLEQIGDDFWKTMYESQDHALRFLSELKQVLSPDTLLLLNELMNPRDLTVQQVEYLHQKYERYYDPEEHRRPSWLIAQLLGWREPRVRSNLLKLRKKATVLVKRYKMKAPDLKNPTTEVVGVCQLKKCHGISATD